jgi:hypothetical protein
VGAPDPACSAATPGFSPALVRAIWIIGALFLLGGVAATYVMSQGSSGGASFGQMQATTPQDPAPGATPELAAQYTAICERS